MGYRRCARRGDIGALTGLTEDPLSCRVRHAHGTFDKQHPECLIVDRPSPEFRPANADDRNGRRYTDDGRPQLRHLTGEKPQGADHPEPDHSAASSRVEDVPIERQLRLLTEC